MLPYKLPYLFELSFKFPPNLIWRKKSLIAILKELQQLKIHPQKILDVGCGSGFLVSIVKKLYPDSILTGIDKSKFMIAFAKSQYGKLAEFKVADFFDHQGKYDLILAFQIFYFFPPEKIIKKLQKLLNPGGVCIIITCAKAPYSILHKFFFSRLFKAPIWLHSPKDFYRVAPSSLFSLKWKLVSETEGSYIITISSK